MIEVEQKFRIADIEALERRLKELGAKEVTEKLQVDSYFNHPSRDFAITDEAFRIRLDGDVNRMTYKGPKLDAKTKSRKEIEFPLGPGTDVHEKAAEALVLLGFRRVREVKKRRRYFELDLRSGQLEKELAQRNVDVPATLQHFEASIDTVEGLGTFAELEASAEDQSLSATRDVLLAVAEIVGLADAERRSYLQLLLEADQG